MSYIFFFNLCMHFWKWSLYFILSHFFILWVHSFQGYFQLRSVLNFRVQTSLWGFGISAPPFFLIGEISPKREIKIKNLKMKWFWTFSIARSEVKNSKIFWIYIFDFHCVAKNIKRWLKIFGSYFYIDMFYFYFLKQSAEANVYSQIW